METSENTDRELLIAVHQTQTGTEKLSTPNLLLLYSFGCYRKKP